MNIQDIYRKLKDEQFLKRCIKKRVIKIVLGSSVIRAYKKETKKHLIDALEKINLNGLRSITSNKLYDEWHRKQIGKLYRALLKLNIKSNGLKWGHSSKILNLFISHIVLYCTGRLN